MKLGVEEYLRLIRAGRIVPEKLDHFLCHYSSHFFKAEIVTLPRSGRARHTRIPVVHQSLYEGKYRRCEHLHHAGRGAEWRPLPAGREILLMVPESGRFTVSFALTDLRRPGARTGRETRNREPAEDAAAASTRWTATLGAGVDPVRIPCSAGSIVDLGLVWADFERMLRETPIVRRIEAGRATLDDYRMLLRNMRQQVMEGARWIARAASNISIDLFPLRSMFISHAGDEHRDYQMLERDYCAVGGSLEEIAATPKNIGSEALSAFMFYRASQPDPLDLLGAMFVIEGLGRRKAGQWAEALQSQLGLAARRSVS